MPWVWATSISIDSPFKNSNNKWTIQVYCTNCFPFTVSIDTLCSEWPFITRRIRRERDQLVARLLSSRRVIVFITIWSVTQCNNCNMGFKLKCLRRSLLLPLVILIVFHTVSSSSQDNPTSAHGKWLCPKMSPSKQIDFAVGAFIAIENTARSPLLKCQYFTLVHYYYYFFHHHFCSALYFRFHCAAATSFSRTLSLSTLIHISFEPLDILAPVHLCSHLIPRTPALFSTLTPTHTHTHSLT